MGERSSDCAICGGTNNTTRLCTTCRSDPANADWSERWEGVELTGEIEKAAYVSKRNGGGCAELYRRTLANIEGRSRKPTKLEVKALELLVYGVVEDFPRYDRKGRFRGMWRRRVDLSQREIALRVGCSQQLVDKVNRRYRRHPSY